MNGEKQVPLESGRTHYLISDICETNSENYLLKENWDTITYLETGGITQNHINSLQIINTYTDKLPSRARRKVKNGDIIYSTVRPNKRHYGYITNQPDHFLVSTGFVTIRAKPELCDSKYLYYYLTQKNITNYLQAIAEQSVSTYPSIRPADIEDMDISLPTLSVQKKIALLLSSIDEKIELNLRMNEVLEELALTLFKHWFVDFEFPNEEGKPYRSSGGKMRDSDMDLIPEGWEIQPAMKYYDISIGRTPPRKEKEWFSDKFDDVRWCSISDMGASGTYISETSEYLTREAIEKFNIVIVPSNTVLLSFKLTVGRVVITNKTMTTNEAIAHFKTNNENMLEYTYFNLKNYDYEELGNTSSIGTAINSTIIKEMPILMPPHEIIDKFHEVTKPILDLIKQNQCVSHTLSEIRDALIPKLMNGTIDIK